MILELDVARLIAEVRVGVDGLQVVDEFGIDGGHRGFEPAAGTATGS